MVPHIVTQGGIAFYIGTKTYAIDCSDPKYQAALDVLRTQPPDADQQLINIVEAAIQAVRQAIELSPSVQLEDGVVTYKGAPIHNSLTERMLLMIEQGFNVDPLIKFLENLMQNPSYRAVNDLYTFLEKSGMPITEDGHFLAYKAIRADWKDIHSGTIDNSIGTVVEVLRNQVDENPERTCSHGLHVCSWDYLPSFRHADGHVVVVKINPADVVAIPNDYNNAKMRVCRYEVVAEHQGYYTEDPQNFLKDSLVFSFAVEEQHEEPVGHQPSFDDWWETEDESEDEDEEYEPPYQVTAAGVEVGPSFQDLEYAKMFANQVAIEGPLPVQIEDWYGRVVSATFPLVVG